MQALCVPRGNSSLGMNLSKGMKNKRKNGREQELPDMVRALKEEQLKGNKVPLYINFTLPLA